MKCTFQQIKWACCASCAAPMAVMCGTLCGRQDGICLEQRVLPALLDSSAQAGLRSCGRFPRHEQSVAAAVCFTGIGYCARRLPGLPARARRSGGGTGVRDAEKKTFSPWLLRQCAQRAPGCGGARHLLRGSAAAVYAQRRGTDEMRVCDGKKRAPMPARRPTPWPRNTPSDGFTCRQPSGMRKNACARRCAQGAFCPARRRGHRRLRAPQTASSVDNANKMTKIVWNPACPVPFGAGLCYDEGNQRGNARDFG